MIETALTYVDPTDRDDWVQVAMAIKSELGDAGFDAWNAWSTQADNYKERDAKAVWRSVKGYGGITIKTLYKMARQNGYSGDEPAPNPIRRVREENLDQRKRDQQRRQRAAQLSSEMISAAKFQVHSYLAKRGHAWHRALVLEDWVLYPGTDYEEVIKDQILVPMRCSVTNQVTSLQRIDADGNKKFIAGGRAKGSIFKMGSQGEVYICEGYATGLSIKAALESLYRKAQVVVCFSAANMAHVAPAIGGFVIADNDASGTGEKYAEKTGLPYWMPPKINTDANDFHVEHGIRALAKELNLLRRANKNGQEALTN